MPDKPKATLYQHPSAPVRLEPPQTAASIATSKQAQQEERATAIAHLLCLVDDCTWEAISETHKAHYLKWARIAMRGSTLGVRQFAIQTVALHAAAQALHDDEARANEDTPHFIHNFKNEQQGYTRTAKACVSAYLGHLSGQDEAFNLGQYGRALGVTE
jgi:hypothetical protein